MRSDLRASSSRVPASPAAATMISASGTAVPSLSAPASGAARPPATNCEAPSIAAAVPAVAPCRLSAAAGAFGNDSPSAVTINAIGTRKHGEPADAGDCGDQQHQSARQGDGHGSGQDLDRPVTAQQHRVELCGEDKTDGVAAERETELLRGEPVQALQDEGRSGDVGEQDRKDERRYRDQDKEDAIGEQTLVGADRSAH